MLLPSWALAQKCMRRWLQFVKFEECYNKKACIKILRQSHLFHCRNFMWPNSDFPERAISAPIANAVYLLRCGRICCRHVFVPDLFLYVGRWWNSYCHIPRHVKVRVQSRTLYGRGGMSARKCIIALGVTWSQQHELVLRVKKQKHEKEEGIDCNNG